jgi:hypothetical protein
LRFNQVCKSLFAPRRSKDFSAADLCLNCLSILAALCLLAPQWAHSQEAQVLVEAKTPSTTETSKETKATVETETPIEAESAVEGKARAKPRVESELIWDGMASYGNYNIFAIEDMTKLYTSGVEYDRHSWGYFIGARMDYVAEVLPFVLLVEPAESDYWGNPLTANRKLVPGVGLSPIGLRMMWRSKKQHFKPYILVKGGIVAFDQKVLSRFASYEDFSLQSGFGVQTRLNDRWDLRLGLWGDFHFSNAYITPSNPGTDVMNANWGLSYHFGQRGK